MADKPNPPKAAPTHEEMRNYAVGALQLMPYMLDATLAYIASSEAKDAAIFSAEAEAAGQTALRQIAEMRIAELEREVAELRKQVPQTDNWLEEDQQG